MTLKNEVRKVLQCCNTKLGFVTETRILLRSWIPLLPPPPEPSFQLYPLVYNLCTASVLTNFFFYILYSLQYYSLLAYSLHHFLTPFFFMSTFQNASNVLSSLFAIESMFRLRNNQYCIEYIESIFS